MIQCFIDDICLTSYSFIIVIYSCCVLVHLYQFSLFQFGSQYMVSGKKFHLLILPMAFTISAMFFLLSIVVTIASHDCYESIV